MEAAPRLPMLSFDLKVCTENTQFAPQLKQYIAAFYNEDPDSYSTEIHNLETLRNGAVRPSMDVNGVQLLKKYYCQLHFLKSRFPMEENQDAAVQFSWKDPQLDISYSCNDINFELMVIMYNIGALHSYLGANDSRSNPDGMKLACTHFQCAAWAFQSVKEKYHQYVVYISLIELVHFIQQICLAQAQECILEKSMLDNRKSTIIAKVAVQVHSYYRQSLMMLETCSEDLFRDKTYKEWMKFLQFKIAYYKCVALLFQGQQAEEQQKMGERVAFYQAASEQLEEAKKYANSLKNKQPEISEALSFTQDVVEGKRKAAKNENEFIYHEEVPTKENLQEVKGASLVKGIGFGINDIEVSGPDIFARLVPIEAHEAASLYSEKKAQMLRNIGELIESKDQNLAEFMSSMQLDMLTKMHQATGIPQEIIDRAASLSAKPNATQALIDVMNRLSGIYQEVESNLKEIDSLLKDEEEAEKAYQEIMGKRPPSIIATDLSREAAKYKEAHNKANDSNQALHRAMMAHVANLKLLQQPLRQLQQQLPSIEMPNSNIDEGALKELETLVSKVEEMRNQRAMLWAQLRESVHEDDITNFLVTKQPSQSLEQFFQQEMKKHDQLVALIEQNTVAQENIKKALVETYAKAINTRRYVQDIIQKRSSTISALMASYDSYDDLLAKANKGIEFYTKLETNVSKLLQRIKSACEVQQEERDQIMIKNDAPKSESNTPKLKDYLDLKRNRQSNVQYSIPGVRPAPLGSEVTEIPKSTAVGNEPNNYLYNYYQDQDMVNRMGNLSFQDGKNNYSSYTPQNYTPVSYPYSSQVFTTNQSNAVTSSYDSTKAFTTTTNSYKVLPSSAQYIDQTSGQDQSYAQYYNPEQAQGFNQNLEQNYAHYTQYVNPSQDLSQTQYNQVYLQQNYNFNPDLTQKTQHFPQIQYPQPSPDVTQKDQNFTQTQYTQPTPDLTQNFPQTQYPQPSPDLTQKTQNYQQNQYPQTNLDLTQPSQNYPQTSISQYPQTNPDLTSQYPQSSTAYSQSINTYYPMGYGPNYPQNQDTTTQNVQSKVSYHNLEYATSVQADVITTNYNSTYSSPVQNLTSYSSFNYPYSYGNEYNNYYQLYDYNVPTTAAQPTPTVTTNQSSQAVSAKKSNIDLLSGLDFTINQAPLIPQQKKPEPQEKPSETSIKTITTKEDSLPAPQPKPTPELKKSPYRILPSKQLNNNDVKMLFNQELEKFEKFVETLTNKTLSGPTNLDMKWKEIQEVEGQKKIISVARCYPMKNRFPDILPYDHSRIILQETKDDYINASIIKDISLYAPAFIVTQLPLSSTIGEFWTMIREQQVELICCLLNDSEMGEDVYFPKEKGRNLTCLNMVLTLQNVITKTHWIERIINISVPEKRESWVVLHLQFTSWPGSLFPTSPEPFTSYVLELINLFQQQRSNIHPVVVHCLSGIGNSGLACLLAIAIFDVTNNANSIPDLGSIASKLTESKRNILRDREHLKFAYECFLAYMRQVVNQDKMKRKLNEVVPKLENESSNSLQETLDKNMDPLSALDPFWASKK